MQNQGVPLVLLKFLSFFQIILFWGLLFVFSGPFFCFRKSLISPFKCPILVRKNGLKSVIAALQFGPFPLVCRHGSAAQAKRSEAKRSEAKLRFALPKEARSEAKRSEAKRSEASLRSSEGSPKASPSFFTKYSAMLRIARYNTTQKALRAACSPKKRALRSKALQDGEAIA